MASQARGEKPKIDHEKVAAMRRVLAAGGDRAVEQRFGEQARASAEFKEAQRQQEERRRQAKIQRERLAAEQEARAHADKRRGSTSGQGKKPAERPDARADALRDRQKEREAPQEVSVSAPSR